MTFDAGRRERSGYFAQINGFGIRRYVQSRQTEDPPHPPHNSWFDHEQDSPTEEEEETRDEFRDYGRHDVQRYNGPLEYGTKRAYFVPSAEKEYSDGNPDTVRKFETETTPNFSTAVSVVDLRSLTGTVLANIICQT